MRHLRNIFIAIVGLVLVFSLLKNALDYQKKSALREEYKVEYENVLDENKKLKSELKKSKDYYYIEKQIREKLNKLKPGEETVIIPKISPSTTPTPVIELKPYQNWSRLYFK